MRRELIIKAAVEAVEEIREKYVPNPNTRYKKGGSTGNLAFNALRYYVEGNTLTVYIDEKIAPYMKYTNEPWTSPKWHGKKNPNEGWWDNIFIPEFQRRFKQKIGGKDKK